MAEYKYCNQPNNAPCSNKTARPGVPRVREQGAGQDCRQSNEETEPLAPTNLPIAGLVVFYLLAQGSSLAMVAVGLLLFRHRNNAFGGPRNEAFIPLEYVWWGDGALKMRYFRCRYRLRSSLVAICLRYL